MRRLLLSLIALTLVPLAAASGAAAKSWGVDKAESAIVFSGVHAGSPFEGRFEDWTANIEFDPEAPQNAVVLVTVETASAKTGTDLYDGTLTGADWFNVESFPQARFEAMGAEPDGAGGYTLKGTLTIRENSAPVALTFKADETKAAADATVTLQRLDFGLGAESDPQGSWVSLEIPVTIKLVAHPSAH